MGELVYLGKDLEQESFSESELEMETKSFNLLRDISDESSGSNLWDSDVKLFLDSTTLKQLFFSESWVYIVVNLIASKIASQYLRVMKTIVIDGQETTEPDQNHPLQKLIDHPNQFESYSAWIYSVIVDLCLIGNAVNWYSSTSNSIMRLPAESITIDFDKEGNLNKYVSGAFGVQIGMVTGNAIDFDPQQIIHLKRPNPSSIYWGLSPFVPGRRQILFDRYTTEYLNNFYLKGATPSYALELTDEANEKSALRMLRSFEMQYTGRRNQRRTMVMPKGVKLVPVSSTLADQKLIDFVDKNRDVILALLNVPPHEVGLQETGSLGSEEHKTALRNFWESTLIPTMRIVEGELTRFFSKQLGNDHFFEFDLSNVQALKEDQMQKALIAKELLNIQTINEIRSELFKLEPLDGGDKLPGSTPSLPSFFSDEPQEIKSEIKQVSFVDYFLKQNAEWFEQRETTVRQSASKAEDEFLKRIANIFSDMVSPILKAVRKHTENKAVDVPSKTELRKAIDEAIQSFETVWTENQVETLQTQIDVGYQSMLNIPFNLPSKDEILALQAKNKEGRLLLLESRALKTFSQISETTTEQIMDIIARGVKESLTLQQNAQNIQNKFGDEITASRALTIARTETLTAVSIGQSAAMEDAKEFIPDLKKMWLSADDGRTRDTHLLNHGKILNADESFDNGLEYPRQPGAPPEEVINCRCTLIMLPQDQMNAINQELQSGIIQS